MFYNRPKDYSHSFSKVINIENIQPFKFGLLELFIYTIDGQLIINYTENSQNLAKNVNDKIINQKYFQIFPELIKNLIQLQSKKKNETKICKNL